MPGSIAALAAVIATLSAAGTWCAARLTRRATQDYQRAAQAHLQAAASWSQRRR